MEMTLSPVCRMFSALSDSEGYHICYPSDTAGAQVDFPFGRSHTAPDAELVHDAEREALLRRSATTRVPTHTEFGMVPSHMRDAGDAEKEQRMDGDRTGNTVMSGGEEHGTPGSQPFTPAMASPCIVPLPESP